MHRGFVEAGEGRGVSVPWQARALWAQLALPKYLGVSAWALQCGLLGASALGSPQREGRGGQPKP